MSRNFEYEYRKNKEFYSSFFEFKKAVKAIKSGDYFEKPSGNRYEYIPESHRDGIIRLIPVDADSGDKVTPYPFLFLPKKNWSVNPYQDNKDISTYTAHKLGVTELDVSRNWDWYNSNTENYYVHNDDLEILSKLAKGNTYTVTDKNQSKETLYKEEFIMKYTGCITLKDERFQELSKILNNDGIDINTLDYKKVVETQPFSNDSEQYYLITRDEVFSKTLKKFGDGYLKSGFIPEELSPIPLKIYHGYTYYYFTNKAYDKLIDMLKVNRKAKVIRGTDKPPYFEWNNNIWESNTTSWYLFLKENFFDNVVQPWMLIDYDEGGK